MMVSENKQEEHSFFESPSREFFIEDSINTHYENKLSKFREQWDNLYLRLKTNFPKKLTYEDFLFLRESIGEAESPLKEIMKPSLFIALSDGDKSPAERIVFSAVLVETLERFETMNEFLFVIMEGVAEQKPRITIKILTETLNNQFEGIEAIRDPIHVSRIPMYAQFVAEKIFFSLDKNNRGFLKFDDFSKSEELVTLIQLIYLAEKNDHTDDNRYSPASFLEVYGTFLCLTNGQKEYLSPEDLQSFQFLGLKFSDTLLDYIFDKTPLLDIFHFFPIFFAMQSKGTERSIRYFFNIIDQKQKGYLDIEDLLNLTKDAEKDACYLNNLNTILFDILKPRTPGRITVNDIKENKQATLIIDLLISHEVYLGWCKLEKDNDL